MADKDADEPSLELPSLSLRRKRRSRRAEPADPAVDERSQPAAPPTPEPPTQPVEPPIQPVETVPDLAEAPPAPVVTEPPPPPERAARKAPRPAREFALPRIGGFPAAILTGVLVGVLTVGLTWGGFRLCEFARGTSSCGDPGFLLLLAILVAMVLLGTSLLRAWGLPDPGATSFLGVGLLAVMVLLFLVQTIFSWWMVIVIPAVAATTFALAHWVTTFVGDAE